LPRFFIITKPALFDKNDRPVPGQCDPDTDGWRLVRFDSDTGDEDILFEGFYDHCRALQMRLAEGGEGFEEAAERFESEAEERRKRASRLLKRISRRMKGRT